MKRLAVGWRVDQSTLSPQVVEATCQIEWCRWTKVAVIDFTIVTNLLEDGNCPTLVEAQVRIQCAFDAQ